MSLSRLLAFASLHRKGPVYFFFLFSGKKKMAQKKALQTIFEKYPFIVTLVMDPTGALM